jgi:chromosome partitioning protein
VSGRVVRAARRRAGAGVTQAQFAKLLNSRLERSYDGARVSKWESGAERVPKIVLDALAAEAAPHVVAVLGPTGSVGATTTAVSLAYGLAKHHGMKVLIADLDPLAFATIHLGGHPAAPIHARTFSALTGDVPPSEAIVSHEDSGIDLLPGHPILSGLENALSGHPREHLRLILRHMDLLEYDAVIIDPPPGIGALFSYVISASDSLIIVTDAGYFAMHALNVAFGLIEATQRLSSMAKILGVLQTRYTEWSDDLERLRTVKAFCAGRRIRFFDQPIPSSPLFDTAQAAGRIAIEMHPDAPAARAYLPVANAVADAALGVTRTR